VWLRFWNYVPRCSNVTWTRWLFARYDKCQI
jgi:hypothetical protein